jgi:N-acetyl-anhydromuramyl-L-alanine amidase AmpD
MLKIGQKSDAVAKLQATLNAVNSAGLTVDGDFGKKTEAALKAYQKQQKSPETGELDAETEAILYPIVLSCATPYFLPRGEYVHKVAQKIGVCLHHTAGNEKAENVVHSWKGDSRKRVATHFVVGANGQILQCLPLQCSAYHIAMGRVGMDNINAAINAGYIGIEICNWGVLTEKNGKFYTYTDHELPADQVEAMPNMRGYKYTHKYTAQQIVAVRKILTELKSIYGWEYEQFTPENFVFDVMPKAQQGKQVLTTHVNFEGWGNKFDCTPQDAFWKMIKDI